MIIYYLSCIFKYRDETAREEGAYVPVHKPQIILCLSSGTSRLHVFMFVELHKREICGRNMIFYILLTHGVRPSRNLREHPAAKSQIRFFKKVISKHSVANPRSVVDYARKANTMSALPNLSNALQILKKTNEGRILIDDMHRLFKIADFNYRESLLEELQEFGAHFHSIKHKCLLSDFSPEARRTLVHYPQVSKHPASQLRHQDTVAARSSSAETRSRNALLRARPLGMLREELIAAHGGATLKEIANEASARGLKTSSGKEWTPQNVARALELLKRGDGDD